jgi:hypothetical protein
MLIFGCLESRDTVNLPHAETVALWLPQYTHPFNFPVSDPSGIDAAVGSVAIIYFIKKGLST